MLIKKRQTWGSYLPSPTYEHPPQLPVGQSLSRKVKSMSTYVLHPLWHTSHSSMVLGGTAVRTRSSTGTAWMNTNSSGGGKKGSSFWPKFNSTTQFLQRTWGRRARSARDSLLIRNATPRPSPFLEKESSTSSASKFYNKRQEHLWAHRACSWLILQVNHFSPSTATQLCKQCINCRKAAADGTRRDLQHPPSTLCYNPQLSGALTAKQPMTSFSPKVWPNSSNCPFSALSPRPSKP